MSKLPLSLLVACASALAAPSLTGATSFTPDDPLFAPSVGSWGQWHLANLADYSSYFPEDAASLPWLTHVQGNNVVGAWALGYTGTGVVIGIIDDGVEGGHPDLLANYRADLSKNFSQGDIANQPQRPYQTDDDHGTSVAGVAAAVGGNGIGVTGAAPHAQIAGLRISSGGTEDDPAYGTRDVINAFLWHSGVTESGNYTGEAVVSIKNNSWGENVPFLATDADAVKVIRNASRNNVIFVFAAGNERGTFSENANTYLLNVAEPVISVAAFGSDGKFSDYSNYGSSTFVTAASNSLTGFEIITTDRVGTPGYDTSDYAYDFGGTSSSAPLVSGILALGKEAAPALDVRWAKHTLANTSLLVDATDSSPSSGVVDWSAPSLTGRGWQTNGAGLHFNPNYGFGMVDAEAFVKRVVETAFVTERTTYTLSKYSIATKLAANSTATATTPALNRDYLYAFKLSGSQITQSLESVEVHVALKNGRAWKDLLIQLVSPDGTVSDLYTPLLNAPTTEEAATATLQGLNKGLDWTFTTNAFWGETGVGDWKLLV
ncbi:MAG: S8 family serine peptidase, partial [Puniceicoccales bacterium]|nr:S8 family serine peptidase [Puniceicoccales bacterium]